ncbi:MAG: potassium transporter TrkA, partial [Pseudomonadota bacterium]
MSNPVRHRSKLADRFKPLRRAVNLPWYADLGLRLGAAFALIGVVVFIHWLDRDGLQDSYDG